jgi:integrase/predicted DNA-binding transcriptional regulator AlpA
MRLADRHPMSSQQTCPLCSPVLRRDSSLNQVAQLLTSLGEDVEIIIRPRVLRSSDALAVFQAKADTINTHDELSKNESRLLSKGEVETLTSLDITTIYRKMSAGSFPQPVRVGHRRVAWRMSDVALWERNLPIGTERAAWMSTSSSASASSENNPPNTPNEAPSSTVTSLYGEYRAHAQQFRTWTEQRRILEKEVLPSWGDRLVRDIRRRDVRDLVNEKARTAPVMANRLLARVSRLFSFAIELDWISINPAVGIPKPTRERTRDRVLSRSELCDVWAALQPKRPNASHTSSRLSRAMCDAFLVMLLTAQRCGEVSRMQWCDVDLDAGWWLIPGEATKNSDPHRVPLIGPAVDILKRRQRLANATSQYVFSNDGKSSVADRAKKAASKLCRDLSFSFRAHDLRRTVASHMGEAGVDRFHIALVLNHRSVTHSSVTAIYDRYRYDKEKRAALEKWSEVLRRIVTSKRAARARHEPGKGKSANG